jgi:hypothetical protein
MFRTLIAAVAVAATLPITANPAAQSTGQASPPPQTTAKPATPKPQVAAPKPKSVRIGVRDQDGASLEGVRLLLTGAGTGEYSTGAAGTAVVPIPKPGLYRVRCEHEGFVPLEREFTVGTGVWNPIDIVLNAAPAPPPPPVKVAPEPPPAPAIPPSGPPVTMSIPDFLDRNFIGRDPLKESIVACKPLETVRLLQMRENIARHVHDRADEVIYVVAGEGAVRIGEETTPIRPGALVVVPNGSAHAFERRGKNPLIVLSTLSGLPCDAPKTTP